MADQYLLDLRAKCMAWADGSAKMIHKFANPKLQEAAARGAIKAGFALGLEEGIRMFAIHKDGQQLVGCLQRPLADVLKEVREVFQTEE